MWYCMLTWHVCSLSHSCSLCYVKETEESLDCTNWPSSSLTIISYRHYKNICLRFKRQWSTKRRYKILSPCHPFWKLKIQKLYYHFFSCTLKYKADAFKFFQFGERIRKAPFSRRISEDSRPDCRYKAAFSWRISVDSRPDCRYKAPFSRRISEDSRPDCRYKAAL